MTTQDVTQYGASLAREGARLSSRKPTALYHCNSCGSPDCSSSCWRSIRDRHRKPEPTFYTRTQAWIDARPWINTLAVDGLLGALGIVGLAMVVVMTGGG